MSLFTLRIQLTLILSLVALLAFTQRRDSVLHHYYKVEKEATLHIDFHHTNLNILPSENDSIAIHTRIRVIPSNPNAPYAGISVSSSQLSSSKVSTSIGIGEEIEPHNELEASCEIHVPQGVHLKLNSRYGIITLHAPIGQLEANITYSNLTVDTLLKKRTHISSDYSTIILKEVTNQLLVDGKNNNLKAKYIKELESNTEFSVFTISEAKSVNAHSYTDKFILGGIDTMLINSQKSLCHIGTLHSFFQGEMENGSLIMNEISPKFKAINISTSHVTSQLHFNANCHFSINADMRYCLLKQEQLNLQEIVSPTSVLYNGNYGHSDNKPSQLSIISAYEDVSIQIK